MSFVTSKHRLGAVATSLLIGSALIAACGASDDPAVIVDGVEISHERFEELHTDVDALDDDERAGSALLLVLREAFVTSASDELSVDLQPAAVDAALDEKIVALEARGDVDDLLSQENETRERLRIEAELDTLSTDVGAHLVLSESDGFDLDTAYQQYSLANAEVCIRQMQLAEAADFDTAIARLDAGEEFAVVARDLSIDPFVDRDEGVGAGGDLGCSAPSALPPGLAEATLYAPIGEATGPVESNVGLHLLVVDDRTLEELADVHDGVLEQAVPVQGPVLFREWAVEVLQSVDVVVDDAYGIWGMLPETEPVPTVVPLYQSGSIIVV